MSTAHVTAASSEKPIKQIRRRAGRAWATTTMVTLFNSLPLVVDVAAFSSARAPCRIARYSDRGQKPAGVQTASNVPCGRYWSCTLRRSECDVRPSHSIPDQDPIRRRGYASSIAMSFALPCLPLLS